MNMMGESGVVSIKVRLILFLETFAQELMLTNLTCMNFTPTILYFIAQHVYFYTFMCKNHHIC